MAGFRKGNKHTFKKGNVPHNKRRTKLLQTKSDSETPKYIRLTRRMHNLVVNDPYTSPEEKTRRASRAAKLLRPKAVESPVANSRKKSANNKR